MEEALHKLRPEGQGGISQVKANAAQVSVRPGGKGESMAVQRAKTVQGQQEQRGMRLKRPAGTKSWTVKGLPSHIFRWISEAAI